MSNRMPEKIWVNNNKFNDHSNGQGVWFNEKVKDDEVSYTRTDTIPKITVVRRNPKGYWEALSDGSKAFLGNDEAAEEEYEGDFDELSQDDIFRLFWVIVPAGEWQGCHPDMSFEEFIEHYQEEGYQVFVIPDVAELQRQNAVLKKFARSIINEKCFGYDGEIDGASVQDQAANCGLITPSTVTREMIDEWERTDNYPSGDFEPGDTIYYFSDWLKDGAAKIPIPSRAQVAREFMDKASSLYCNTDASSLWNSMLRLHAEWEEADGK